MDADNDLDIVAIADGITVWYELQDPDECLVCRPLSSGLIL